MILFHEYLRFSTPNRPIYPNVLALSVGHSVPKVPPLEKVRQRHWTLVRYCQLAWRWANSVYRVSRVGRPSWRSRSTEVPPVGGPRRTSRSTEIAKGVGCPRQWGLGTECPTLSAKSARKSATPRWAGAALRPDKSPSERRQLPVGPTSKARRLALETLRAIDSEPSGN